MNQVNLSLEGNRQCFQPGEQLRGQATWDLGRPPAAIEVRLSWFTEGAGIPEAQLVARQVFQRPASTDSASFAFTLPPGPYSFNGTLMHLMWAIEIVALPGNDCARIVFSLSPSGHPLLLSETAAALTVPA